MSVTESLGGIDMRKKLLLFLSLFCIFASMFSITAFAARGPLDEIQNYTIQVDMRPDGTMDIKYHIVWKVLDDTSEVPLSWVKIGNPNKYVDQITALSSNIKNIEYYADGGSYIRIDFDREYKKNEVITFEYVIHQSRMYVIDKDAHLCRYSFTPGWFDEIEVKEIKILWNSANVIESNSHTTEGNYLVWTGSLKMSERLNASVKYNLDVFTTNEDEQYTDESGSVTAGTIIGIILLITIIIIVLIALFGDDYDSHSGFGGRRSTFIHTHSSVRSSCACVSSCACACACAGGGRAGCSKKDFYGTNLNTDDIKKVLNK